MKLMSLNLIASALPSPSSTSWYYTMAALSYDVFACASSCSVSCDLSMLMSHDVSHYMTNAQVCA